MTVAFLTFARIANDMGRARANVPKNFDLVALSALQVDKLKGFGIHYQQVPQRAKANADEVTREVLDEDEE